MSVRQIFEGEALAAVYESLHATLELSWRQYFDSLDRCSISLGTHFCPARKYHCPASHSRLGTFHRPLSRNAHRGRPGHIDTGLECLISRIGHTVSLDLSGDSFYLAYSSNFSYEPCLRPASR